MLYAERRSSTGILRHRRRVTWAPAPCTQQQQQQQHEKQLQQLLVGGMAKWRHCLRLRWGKNYDKSHTRRNTAQTDACVQVGLGAQRTESHVPRSRRRSSFKYGLISAPGYFERMYKDIDTLRHHDFKH